MFEKFKKYFPSTSVAIKGIGSEWKTFDRSGGHPRTLWYNLMSL